MILSKLTKKAHRILNYWSEKQMRPIMYSIPDIFLNFYEKNIRNNITEIQWRSGLEFFSGQ